MTYFFDILLYLHMCLTVIQYKKHTLIVERKTLTEQY